MSQIMDQLKILLGLDASGVRTGGEQAKAVLRGISQDLEHLKTAVAGYFTVDVFKELVRSGVEYADMLSSFKDQFAVSTDAAQRYDRAATRVGLSLETVGMAFDKLAQSREKALKGDQESMNQFTKLGLTYEQLQSLTTGEKLFAKISEHLGDASNLSVRSTWRELFGRSGGRLIGFAEMLNKQGDITVLPEEDIEKLFKAANDLKDAAKDLRIGAAEMASKLVEWLRTAGEYYTGGTDATRQATQGGAIEQAVNIVYGDQYSPEQKARAREFLGRAASLDYNQGGPPGVLSSRLRPRLTGGMIPMGQEDLNQWIAEFAGYAHGRARPDIPEEYRSLPPAPDGGGTGGPAYELNPVLREKLGRELNDAISNAYMRVGSRAAQRDILGAELLRLRRETEDLVGEGKFEEAAGRSKSAIGIAAQLAQLSAGSPFKFSPDSLAAIGGFVGGATALDPSVIATQDIRALLERWLPKLDYLRPTPTKDLTP